LEGGAASKAMSEQEEFEFRLRLEKEQAAAAKPAAKAEPTTAEKIAADPFTRFAIGAAEPWQGIVQRVSEMNPGINPILLQAKLAAQFMRPTLDESFASAKEMAKAGGLEGVDIAGIAGNVMSPVSLAAGKIPIAGTLKGKIQQGALTGAFGGAIAPADTPEDVARNATLGVAVGGLLPPAITGVGKTAEVLGNKVVRPVSDLFTQEGGKNIANRYVRNIVGEENIPATVSAARSATSPKVGPGAYEVDGYKPVLAETMTGVPEGSPLAALQDITSKTKGGISARFGRRAMEQENAIAAAKDAAEAAGAPLRNTALANANVAGDYLPKLLDDIKQKFASRASALQSEGKLNTFAAQQENLANTWTPVPGMPRFPGRYAPQMENVAPAKAGAEVAGGAATQRTSEEAFKKFQADSLARHGYFPLESEAITNSLDAVMNKPGNVSNKTIQKALGELKDTLRSVTNKYGVVDARELYTIRKIEAGNVINQYAKDHQNWDKKMTAGLLRDVQKAIDDAIEQSGGSGWKDYLREYGGRMQAIDAMLERSKGMYSPPQKTNLGGGVNITSETTPHTGNFLWRPAMISNWILRLAAKGGETKVDRAIADMMLDPGKYADELSKTPKLTAVDIEKWLRRANALSAGVGQAQ
jgi:hypothetical protein